LKKENSGIERVLLKVKSILKKVLPAPLLKQAFLVYNTVRIRTIDRLVFPEYHIPNNQFLLYRKGYPFREENISLGDLPAGDVKNYMQDWYQWTQEEFILEFNSPCWIEPQYGWAIVPPNKLVYYALGVSRTLFQPKPRLLAFWRRKKITTVSKAISLRDTGEENYFHWFNDVLAKLYFLRKHRIEVGQLPVIISKKLWDKSYFQYYLSQSSWLQSLQWLVQDDQYIHCASLIFCKPLTHRSDLWSEITSVFKLPASNRASRKIFLTRHQARLRFIENSDEIEDICRKQGYEIIDTDALSPQQQIEVFSSVSHLIGIHGAGLTNMVFCPPGCRVLELFPPPDAGYLPYHYIMLARIRGFKYQALIGSAPEKRFSGGFRIEPERFFSSMNWINMQR
jgi:hypothetical protein